MFGTVGWDMQMNNALRVWLAESWQLVSAYQKCAELSFCEGCIAEKLKWQLFKSVGEINSKKIPTNT